MIERKVYRPRCCKCEFHLCYNGDVPQKLKGVFLKAGYRYCTAGKRAWQLTRKEAKATASVPTRCPLVRSPIVLRIYCYKDDSTSILRTLFSAQGVPCSPSEYQYAMRYEGNTMLTAYQFQRLAKQQRPADLLGVPLHTGEVIEIDDGLVPYCFYLESSSIARCIYFSGQKARKNRLEEN